MICILALDSLIVHPELEIEKALLVGLNRINIKA